MSREGYGIDALDLPYLCTATPRSTTPTARWQLCAADFMFYYIGSKLS